MRIGIVTDNYFPSVGGTEISIWNYTRSLEKQGHEVFVFCPSLGRKNPKKKRPSTVRLRSIRYLYPDHPIMFVYPGITKTFRNYNLDIIHSQTPVSAPYVGEYVARKLGIPHVHTMHTLLPEQMRRMPSGLGRMIALYIIQSFILRTFRVPHNYLLQDEKQTLAIKVRLCWVYMRRLLELPDAIIFPSKHVEDILIERGFRGSSYLLPTFSDMFVHGKAKVSTRTNRTTCRIIYVGRLDVEKRPQVVIDAVNLLPRDLDWELVVIGSGQLRNKLKALVKRYKLQDRVEFKGRLRQAVIAQELLDADIFVMSSYRFDTQGIVLLEACGAGLPIVYCDNNLTVGVEKSNSILTKSFAGSMSAGLRKLIKDESLRKNLSQGSCQVAKKYQPGVLTKKLISIYSETLKRT